MGKLKQQHNLSLILLSLTAVIWGAGFVLGNRLFSNGFQPIPMTLNTIRFACGAVVLLIVFGRKLQLNKQVLLFGGLGGLSLCIGFNLQLLGLSISRSPTSCGFFTAAYTVFVPFAAWIICKRRPSWMMFAGAVIAMAGLAILSLQALKNIDNSQTFWGNMITLSGSLFFAFQIVLSDYVLHDKKLKFTDFTVVQVVSCAVTMAIVALIFEAKKYPTVVIEWNFAWWKLIIVSVFGTAFAYYSQTFAQQHLSPTETSIIMACESPIGAILAISIGDDTLTWQVIVGGLLVLAAIVLVEVLPTVVNRHRHKPEVTHETATDTPDQPTE